MTPTTNKRVPTHQRWIGAAVLAALAVLATATSAAATTPPGSDETTTTVAAEPTTTTGAASTSTAAATTTAPAPTTALTNFAATLAAECEGDTGHQLLASGLQVLLGEDGSLRIVEILLTCDIEFVGAVDPTLARPLTNVEAIIADPANNITPNQAQTDLLNEELASYWRITDAWVQSQAATPATTTAGATTTVAAESSVPTADAATSTPDETATTGG